MNALLSRIPEWMCATGAITLCACSEWIADQVVVYVCPNLFLCV